MNPDTTKLLESLPVQWQINFVLGILMLHFLVRVGEFIANHGGTEGLKNTLKYGKKPPGQISS